VPDRIHLIAQLFGEGRHDFKILLEAESQIRQFEQPHRLLPFLVQRDEDRTQKSARTVRPGARREAGNPGCNSFLSPRCGNKTRSA
jgi:hypothetical protein